MAEAAVGLCKNECARIDGPFKAIDELELLTLDWIHRIIEHYLHSSIKCLTPIEIEQHYRERHPQQQPILAELSSAKPGMIHYEGARVDRVLR
ncbi:hypothetical protein [Salinibacterium sp.]|uniref:hypothetical protein n=1 Tax=Salinibacterium sp. TaxID=1915057 RepID=UPI0037CBC2AE